MSFWIFWAVLMGSAFLWSRMERLNDAFRAGRVPAGWNLQRTGLTLNVTQGVLSILLFGLIGLGFYLFGWKLGLGFTLLALWVGSWR